MLTIYDSKTTNFSNLGLGVLRDFKSDPIITEVLNGLYNLEFDYYKDGWLNEFLVEGNIIKADNQKFRIWNVSKTIEESKITILAKATFFDLEKSGWLEDVAPTNKNAVEALQWCFDRATTPVNYVARGDCEKIASARYVRTNIIEAVYNVDNSILKKFGGEIEINNEIITIHSLRGKSLGLEIRQKKNLQGANYQVDLSTVATRIIPIGNDGLLLPEKYIDSPLINNYYSPFYYKYELDIGVDEENGITAEDCYEQMRLAVEELFKAGIDKPTVSVSIDFVELSKTLEYQKYSNLETAHLGDSCKIYIPGLNLSMETRIVKTVKNLAKNRITSLELGSVLPNYVSSNVDSDTLLKNAVKKVNPESILSRARQNATDLINHPFNGYIYIDDNSGEMYLMDTTDPKTATKIWKFGLGGIGYSSNGLNGPFDTAITSDGQIVADFITAGTLSTNVIEGYNELIVSVYDDINSTQDRINNLENDLEENYMTSEEANIHFVENKENIDSINKKLTELAALADSLTIRITNINENGVNRVVTSTGFVFDEKGLNISKTGEAIKNLIDNTGLFVKRNDEEVLGADPSGVRAENVTVRKWLVIGKNSRMEDYMNGRTGIFYIGK